MRTLLILAIAAMPSVALAGGARTEVARDSNPWD